jgi:MoxR-like ATPase
MTHRLVLTSEAGIKDINAETIVTDLLDSVEVPGAATTSD